MASAIALKLDASDNMIEATVLYSGADVPGVVLIESTKVAIDPGQTIAQIEDTLAARIRARAGEIGFSIPSNQVSIQSFKKA